MLLVFIDERNRSNEIIVTSIKSVKDSAVREILPGLLLSFCHRCLQQASCYLSATVRWSDYCYFIGYFIRKYFFKQPVLAIGTKFAESKLLEFSVFLLGATVTAQTIAQIGIKGIVFVLLQMSVTIIGAYLIGKKLQFSDTSSLMMAGGNAVCGSSAIASIALPSMRKRKKRTDHHTSQSTGYCDDVDSPFLGLQLFGGNLIEKVHFWVAHSNLLVK